MSWWDSVKSYASVIWQIVSNPTRILLNATAGNAVVITPSQNGIGGDTIIVENPKKPFIVRLFNWIIAIAVIIAILYVINLITKIFKK